MQNYNNILLLAAPFFLPMHAMERPTLFPSDAESCWNQWSIEKSKQVYEAIFKRNENTKVLAANIYNNFLHPLDLKTVEQLHELVLWAQNHHFALEELILNLYSNNPLLKVEKWRESRRKSGNFETLAIIDNPAPDRIVVESLWGRIEETMKSAKVISKNGSCSDDIALSYEALISQTNQIAPGLRDSNIFEVFWNGFDNIHAQYNLKKSTIGTAECIFKMKDSLDALNFAMYKQNLLKNRASPSSSIPTNTSLRQPKIDEHKPKDTPSSINQSHHQEKKLELSTDSEKKPEKSESHTPSKPTPPQQLSLLTRFEKIVRSPWFYAATISLYLGIKVVNRHQAEKEKQQKSKNTASLPQSECK